MTKPVYVLGTGLSHNGSAVLLKDGRVCAGIEKERLTRRKHDGGNDTEAIRYVLEAEGIGLQDIALTVQCANFEVPPRDRFLGPRLFADHEHPPLVSISHHLAHAYSAAGTCPFGEAQILVIDGCGSPYAQCTDLTSGSLADANIPEQAARSLWCEKDSLYHFNGQKVIPLFKDFSEMAGFAEGSLRLPTTRHSIGGFYAAVSQYVFGNMDDAGKLMGLAPYGRPGQIDAQALEMRDGRLWVGEAWKALLDRPAEGYADFKAHFQYFADVAYWAQQEVERAVLDCVRDRLVRFPHTSLCYTGGVALNAAANARILDQKLVKNLYLEPAAGDNGLALGCAYYGWLEVLGRERVPHSGSTCFGRNYRREEIAVTEQDPILPGSHTTVYEDDTELVDKVASLLAAGRTVAWFCSGSEFGPRALGRRSILAHPGIAGLKDHINRNIKFREDFRPFAPAVLAEEAEIYFQAGRESPYMILLDRVRPEYGEQLNNVVHVDGTARVQTVTADWNPRFAALLRAFRRHTGLGVLLNTSLNRRGQPMVESPQEALVLFTETALDVLVLENRVMEKEESR